MLPRFLFSLMMRTSISVALQAIEVAHRTQIDLRAGQERARAQDIDSQAALDAVDDARLDRSLVVIGLLDFVPGAQSLRLLVGEVDVALFRVARLAHDGDFIAGLDRDVAFVVGELRHGNHAFGLVADIDHHILRRDLQHVSGNDLFVVERGFGLRLLLLERFQSGGEIFHAGLFVYFLGGHGFSRCRGCGGSLRSCGCFRSALLLRLVSLGFSLGMLCWLSVGSVLVVTLIGRLRVESLLVWLVFGGRVLSLRGRGFSLGVIESHGLST